LSKIIVMFFLCSGTSLQGNWAQQTFESMTLQEKIGQMFVVAAASCFDKNEETLSSALFKSPYKMDPEYIRYLIQNHHIGGLIFLYQSTPEKQIDFTNEYQRLSKYPLLIAQDCEWGLSMRLDDTISFPRNMTLGTLTNRHLIYEVGKEIGKQCKAIGVHLNCAPVVDVNNNPNNPVINTRSFGSDKETVAECATLMMHGMQDAGILTCAKHFPGHGDTSTDSHLTLPVINHSKERLHNLELYPFKELIKEGVDTVMMAHLNVLAFDASGISSSLSKNIVTNILQKELGFNGLVLTDGLGMQAITNHCNGAQAALQAFKAGNTILLCPLDVSEAIQAIEQFVKEDPYYLELLTKNVLKILNTKERLGIHKNRLINKEEALKQLHTKEAYALKEKILQASI